MTGASGSPLLDAASTVLLVGSAGVAVTTGAAVVAVTVAVRRVRRSPAVAAASLRMHLLTESGPRRDVVRLRLELLRAVDGGRAAIGAADPRTGLPGEAPALLRRIQREAATVDQHLRLLQGEDDDRTLRAALPALRRRVTELVEMVRRLRSAVAAGLEAASHGAVAELSADVEREVAALRAGRERLRAVDGLDGRPTWSGEGAIR
jgi:cob(I)alamin adenosyltransferase